MAAGTIDKVEEAMNLYLELDDLQAAKLSQMAAILGTSQSEVVQRAIDTLAQTVLPAKDEPLLSLIGLAGTDSPGDLAERHDEYLAQAQKEDNLAAVPVKG
jgi:hypothetical protein